MRQELLNQRLDLLADVDRLLEGCEGCATRAHFNNLKDATGLSHACKACPLGNAISQYGERLLPLVEPRKKIKINAKESIDV